MTAQDLALRSAIPPELLEAGVSIQEDEGGYRRIVFPDEIKKHFNVLLPVSEIARTDPNYTPAIRAARIDVEQHTYHDSNSKQGERSLNKLGLYALARVAGLGVPQTRRMPVSELGEGKVGWQATVIVRRSDGTPEPITASKVVDQEVEREKVLAGVRRMSGKSREEMQSIFDRRWLYEREHMESKCETKAVERAIRAALQIPHAFSEAALAKPFLVVGYSFTPDMADPEVRRLVIEAGLSAGSRLYGGAQAPREIESSPASEPAGGGEGAGDQTMPPGEVAAAGAPSATTPAPDAADEPAAFEGEEPGERADFTPPAGSPAGAQEEAVSAGLTVVGFGKHAGRTLADIAADSEDYVRWLAQTMEPRNDAARSAKSAAQAYVRLVLGGAS